MYGTLQPGGPNEHVLGAIAGTWTPATIKGRLVQAGWGATMGYAGLVIDPTGDEISGDVFAAATLAQQWPRLDAFEGAEYERVTEIAKLASGDPVETHVYVLRGQVA